MEVSNVADKLPLFWYKNSIYDADCEVYSRTIWKDDMPGIADYSFRDNKIGIKFKNELIEIIDFPNQQIGYSVERTLLYCNGRLADKGYDLELPKAKLVTKKEEQVKERPEAFWKFDWVASKDHEGCFETAAQRTDIPHDEPFGVRLNLDKDTITVCAAVAYKVFSLKGYGNPSDPIFTLGDNWLNDNGYSPMGTDYIPPKTNWSQE